MVGRDVGEGERRAERDAAARVVAAHHAGHLARMDLQRAHRRLPPASDEPGEEHEQISGYRHPPGP